MADAATLQTYLTEAESALHKLYTGQKEITITYEGRSVTYNQTSIGKLETYITNLKYELGTASPRRWPRVTF